MTSPPDALRHLIVSSSLLSAYPLSTTPVSLIVSCSLATLRHLRRRSAGPFEAVERLINAGLGCSAFVACEEEDFIWTRLSCELGHNEEVGRLMEMFPQNARSRALCRLMISSSSLAVPVDAIITAAVDLERLGRMKWASMRLDWASVGKLEVGSVSELAVLRDTLQDFLSRHLPTPAYSSASSSTSATPKLAQTPILGPPLSPIASSPTKRQPFFLGTPKAHSRSTSLESPFNSPFGTPTQTRQRPDRMALSMSRRRASHGQFDGTPTILAPGSPTRKRRRFEYSASVPCASEVFGGGADALSQSLGFGD